MQRDIENGEEKYGVSNWKRLVLWLYIVNCDGIGAVLGLLILVN